MYQFLVHGFTCGLLKALTCAVDFIKIDCRSSLPIYASPRNCAVNLSPLSIGPVHRAAVLETGNSLPVSKRILDLRRSGMWARKEMRNR